MKIFDFELIFWQNNSSKLNKEYLNKILLVTLLFQRNLKKICKCTYICWLSMLLLEMNVMRVPKKNKFDKVNRKKK